MRITDDRYQEERLSMELALRMIRHEARTCTIRLCTGLSDDRIRKLYKAYVSGARVGTVRRRRGKSPRQVAYFTRNVRAQLESTILAGVFACFSMLRPDRGPILRENSLEFGMRFCNAYDTYRQAARKGQLSFEHAWFLRRVLATRNELCFDHCHSCAGVFVRDTLAIAHRGCPLCTLRSDALPP